MLICTIKNSSKCESAVNIDRREKLFGRRIKKQLGDHLGATGNMNADYLSQLYVSF